MWTACLENVEQVDLVETRLPLSSPYLLSYGSIDALQSVFVRLRLASGAVGWGESTVLPGYCECSLEDVWATSVGLVEQLVAGEPCRIPGSGEGFPYTAVWTAIEMLNLGLSVTSEDIEVPLAALVQGENPEELRAAVLKARRSGFRTFKIKAGFASVEVDRARLEATQDVMEEGERLRIDPNQAFSLNETQRVLAVCQPEKVEFLEQPILKSCASEIAALSRDAQIAILLDEAIIDRASLEHYLELGFQGAIKLKWMKAGGWQQLTELVELASDSGHPVVLGNGVSSGTGLLSRSQVLECQALYSRGGRRCRRDERLRKARSPLSFRSALD